MTNRHAAAHTLGISIGATNLVATSGSQAVVHPAVLRTAQGGWLSGFVDRIGDPVPLVASDGSTHRPEVLLTEALEAVTSALPGSELVSDVAVTVPAHWPTSVVDALRTSLPHTTRLVPDATAALRGAAREPRPAVARRDRASATSAAAEPASRSSTRPPTTPASATRSGSPTSPAT